ncbi:MULTISPECIES: hypothetical protein [Comamonas]|uniref:hypothetical protein n=1 Tax=Comamonas TaxID=283 RepID=UPI00103E34B5|nr:MULTISPECIES: hypothetical protein [Comamonas]TFF58271.1 hypothetical protein EIC84_16245 [Comamonas sp. A23]
MALLDLEDSSDIKVNNSHTSAETLLKGRRVKRVELNDSTAGINPLISNEAVKPESGKEDSAGAPPSGKSDGGQLWKLFGKALWAIIPSLVVAYLVYRFGWN